MEAKDFSKDLIGRRCKAMAFGQLEDGTITDVQEEQNTYNVKVRYDRPIRWGDDLYEEGWNWMRKCDNFGSLSKMVLM